MSVVAINNLNSNDQEYLAFKQSIQFQNWSYKVQSIIHATGLPVNSDFTNKDLMIPGGSPANRFGHRTIGEFIINSDVRKGVGLDWNDWVSQFTAFNLKSQFGIYEDDANEILSQVKDVEKALGRMPLSSAEYHKAKEEILLKIKREDEVRHQLESREFKAEVESLKIEIEQYKDSILSIEQNYRDYSSPGVLVSYIERLDEKEKEIISLKAKVATMESNSQYHATIDVQKLMDDFNLTMSYLGKYRQQNTKLKGKVSELTYKINKLKNKLKKKEKLIQSLVTKNSRLFNIQLFSGSLLFITTSTLLVFIMLIS